MSQTTSWVIKEKGTGAIIFETFDKKKVTALNTARYEAVPILEHLASLTPAKEEAPTIADQSPPQNNIFSFHANLVALVTNTSASDWTQTAHFDFSNPNSDQEFAVRNGNDIFSAYRMMHKAGRVAQIEYDSMDYLFVDSGETNWSGPLEDEVVGKAEKLSGAQGWYEKLSLATHDEESTTPTESPRG